MMNDQASSLRKQIYKNPSKTRPTKVITITSGKGGVGKSNFTLNFALALQESGHKTAILDADIGLANIDVLLGISPKYSLPDMVNAQLTIWDVMEKGPLGLEIIAGGSALETVFEFQKDKLQYLFNQMVLLNGYVDTLLVDTGAGIHQESLKMILSSDEVFLVTTPEPTSITDAYAMIKIIQSKKKDIKIKLIINRAANEKEALNTAERIMQVTERFLNFKLELLGYIHDDDSVRKSVKKQEPFFLSFPHSKASQSVKLIADRYINQKKYTQPHDGVGNFLTKMTFWFRKG